MSWKDLLVIVDTLPTAKGRIAAAAELARRFDAHLTGLFLTPPAVLPTSINHDVTRQLMGAMQEEIRNAAQQQRALFEDVAAREGVAAEWRTDNGLRASERSALHARYSDLTIVGQLDPDRQPRAVNDVIPEELAFASGRPVLVVPYIGVQRSLGERVIVAWNGTREAARAVQDAMPLLRRANQVTVLEVNPEQGPAGHHAVPGAEMARYLARHGVTADASQTVTVDIDVADALLSRVSDLDGDLVVMGIYGHSRLREFVLGGVSRSLLEQMTVPLLISH